MIKDKRIKEKDWGSCSNVPGLESKMKNKAGTLSGGQQQMLALAKGTCFRAKSFALTDKSLEACSIIVKEVLKK